MGINSKKNTSQPRILYPAEQFFKNKGVKRTFPDTQKLREFVTKTTALQEILKTALQKKLKGH